MNMDTDLNWVELMSGTEPAPCAYGAVVEGHACYCHHRLGPRKCHVWRNGLHWTKENCELFERTDETKP